MTQPTTEKTVFKTRAATIDIIDDSIFRVVYNEGAIIEAADFDENLKIFNDWSKGQDEEKFVLHNYSQFSTATAEARAHAATFEVHLKAEAFVFSNLGQRILIRFYILTVKNKHPIRVFSSPKKALAWLKQF